MQRRIIGRTRLNRAMEGNLADLTEYEDMILALRFPREDNQRLMFREISEAVRFEQSTDSRCVEEGWTP